MEKKYLAILFCVSFLILMLPLGSSFMPKYTHRYITDEALATPINSEWYKACVKYPQLCYSGNILTDISVIYYYTQRGKYTATHTPPFCMMLLSNIAKIPGKDPEKMRACAIGGCMHQAEDLASHSLVNGGDGLVTYAIKHSYLANMVVHVFAEQKTDNYLERKDPSLGKSSEDYLGYYQECQDLFTTSLMGETAYQGMTKADLDSTFNTFVNEIRNSQNTGYNQAFQDKSLFITWQSIPFVILAIFISIMLGFLLLVVLLIIKLIKGDLRIRVWIGLVIFIPIFSVMAYLFVSSLMGTTFNNFITLIKPISELVPVGSPDTYINSGISNTKMLLTQGEGWLIGKDASGMSTVPVLSDADSGIMLFDYLVLTVIIALLGLFIWFIFKKNKIKLKDSLHL